MSPMRLMSYTDQLTRLCSHQVACRATTHSPTLSPESPVGLEASQEPTRPQKIPLNSAT